MSEATTSQAPFAKGKELDAIFQLLAGIAPQPRDLLDRVRAYLDTRAREDAEVVRAQWITGWLSRRQDWLERLGKLLTAAQVAALSPSMKTPAAVHKARHEGRLLAFDLGERTYFPEFQFQKDGKPASWVRTLAQRISSSDTLLQFLAAGRTGQRGRSFAEMLREGGTEPHDIEGMLKAALEIMEAEAR
jgi:hypothetical protein